MPKSKKLGIGLIGTAAVAAGVLAIPVTAEADTCTIAVTLSTGQQLSFAVDVPPGTPLSAINLPVTTPVASVSESCASSQATTTTGTTTTGAPLGVTGTTTTSAQTTTTSSTTETDSTTTGSLGFSPASPLGVTLQAQSSHTVKHTSGISTAPAAQPTTTAGGAPTANNPTYSFALPGAATIGVPNFFIDSFDIPPFLLPIYQAAGIEYNVPWQVLAAINWIETDYGRDLSVSSAGAVGWMQFLPSTWERWGVDATGTGYADPYNPTDAIFTAARYLAAAGASKNLSQAIFSYNHAGWYVQSVLLRAQLIGGMPADLVSSLTQLVEGHFPVASASTYADDSVVKTAERKDDGSEATVTVDSGTAKGTDIFAKPGAEVIAVNDGKIVGLGRTKALGNFIKLQDDNGNVYTYSGLGSIPKLYAVPKPVSTTPAELQQEVSGGTAAGTATKAKAPTSAASAGLQPGATVSTGTTTVPVATRTKRSVKQTLKSLLTVKIRRAGAQGASRQATQAAGIKSSASAPVRTTANTATATSSGTGSSPAQSVASKERLFANPTDPSSYAAGGEQQLLTEGSAISSFKNYFSDVLHLDKDQYTLAPLTKGSVVVAGTVLGRLGAAPKGEPSHVYFQIQPGGAKSAYIDPKPVLDGWKLLEATSIYRANGLDPFLSSSRQATIGQILLESKSQLQETVLRDPRISIYACGRRDVAAGSIDRRILAVMEYLASSGLDPTVSGLKCGAGTTSGIDAAGQTGASMDISAINGIPIAGHTNTGSITDITIRRLLTLQGAMSPTEIISPISYKGQANTLALPDHMNRIQVTFTPEFGTDKKLTDEVTSVLKPNQWIQLISHIGEIPEPSVPTSRSAYAIKTNTQ